ncbi:MAG: Eco57I restriction-modification methylase domain-containing protein [Myxococcota bacterium]
MARTRSGLALERWLEVLASFADWPRAELARQFRDSLLRSAAKRLLADARLTAPVRMRLFELDARATELERWISESDERSETRAEASELLLSSLEPLGLELPHALGALFEGLASFDVVADNVLQQTRRRKQTGMFYTPSAVAHEVAQRALEVLPHTAQLNICDPACGSGAFLVETARALAGNAASLAERRRAVDCLLGVDLDARALHVAELALWAFVADPDWDGVGLRLHEGDALLGKGLHQNSAALPRARGVDWRAIAGSGFELVIGNPPWVAFAGRAAQPLESQKRAHYLRQFVSFRGYPTLHALFVERALELAPHGIVALLVPSPIADLDGYRALRRRLLTTHEPCEPLLEFGQDAFQTVTQPCFALIARPRTAAASQNEENRERRFRLAEREVLGEVAQPVDAPEVLLRVAEREAFPRELFGELGFQSNRVVSSQLFLRADAAKPPYTYPLLEGREVSEFSVGEPRLFLHPDAAILKKTRCKLRLPEDYRRVRFVVRQTAKFPIAALHNGLPFRNTLLAGFADHETELSPELVVGLLNSSLYRALHLARQRDARQKVFPQVKVAHLRALPRPPRGNDALCERVRELTRSALARPRAELRRELDSAVFQLFDLSAPEQEQVLAFVAERAPELIDND